MHLPLIKFHMYLEDYYFCRSQTQVHGEIKWKVLWDAELRKGMTKTPTNSTHTEQSTTGKRSRSSPKLATWRWFLEVVVKGWLTLGGEQPPLGASLPLLALAVACLHAEAVELLFRAKISVNTASCILTCMETHFGSITTLLLMTVWINGSQAPSWGSLTWRFRWLLLLHP
jgi:hypothetical protein